MDTRLRVRDWALIGLFGGLWGAVEITLGSLLHLIFPPMADTFFTGIVLAGIGCLVALTARSFVPRRGSILLIGVIAAFLKVFSLGGIVIGPVVAILAESLLMEAALLPSTSARRAAAARPAGRWSYLAAGALAVSWNFFHKIVMSVLLFGMSAMDVMVRMARDGSRLLSLDARLLAAILGVLLLFRVVAGAAAGALAWELGGAIRRRMEAGHERSVSET